MKRLRKTLALALFAMALGIAGTITSSFWTQYALAEIPLCEYDFCSYLDDTCHRTDVPYTCDMVFDGACNTAACQ